MAVKRGLNKGRGLSALIPQKRTQVRPAEETVERPAAKSAADPAARPAGKPTAKSAAKPAAKPAAKTAAKPGIKTGDKPAAKSAAKPAAKQTARSAGKTAAKPAAKQAAKSAPKRSSKPVSSAAEETRKEAVSAPAAETRKEAISAPAEETRKEAVSAPAAETLKEAVSAPAAEARKEAVSAPAANDLPESAASPAADVKTAGENIIRVLIDDVIPAVGQPRKRFNDESIKELAESIREHGIVTPLLVRKAGGKFELIAGERRWRAAKLAGIGEVPVITKDLNEEQTRELAIIDNIQRENLNAIEEAQAYLSLINEFGLKQEDVARKVSRSRAAVTNALRLLKLEETVQEMLIEGRLSMGHARALLAIEDPDIQRKAAEQTAASGASVRETEKLVKRLLSPVKRARRAEQDAQTAAIYADLEEQLRRSVGTKVSIHKMRGKKGTVEIEYYSNEDLERIIDLLRGSM